MLERTHTLTPHWRPPWAPNEPPRFIHRRRRRHTSIPSPRARCLLFCSLSLPAHACARPRVHPFTPNRPTHPGTQDTTPRCRTAATCALRAPICRSPTLRSLCVLAAIQQARTHTHTVTETTCWCDAAPRPLPHRHVGPLRPGPHAGVRGHLRRSTWPCTSAWRCGATPAAARPPGAPGAPGPPARAATRGGACTPVPQRLRCVAGVPPRRAPPTGTRSFAGRGGERAARGRRARGLAALRALGRLGRAVLYAALGRVPEHVALQAW
jgi:hypothetical protein